MSQENNQQNTQSSLDPVEEKSQQSLSRRRRTALVGYMAILFAVAFLLVALSMVIENKRLQSSRQELLDKNKQTSASLNGKIAELQTSYDNLKKQSDEQQQEVARLTEEAGKVPELESAAEALAAERDGLSAELETRTQERDALQTEVDGYAEEKAALESQIEALQSEKDALTEQAEKTAAVHELLYQAVEANENRDYDALEELLAQIEPDLDLLCPTARDIYESLTID